jgi:hypothetical protein
VDSKAGSVLLCFLNCYSGYHQIALNPDDQDKKAFITPNKIYYYKLMTFGLKNVGATYQKVIQKCLKSQIGKNVEAYILMWSSRPLKEINSSTISRNLRQSTHLLLSLTSIATRFISLVTAPESLLVFLTSLLDLQQC